MQIILLSFATGIATGIIGAVYRHVLAYEKILSWWFAFGNRFEQKWFFNPVWGCSKCFAGQLAGWFWLLSQVVPSILRHPYHISCYSCLLIKYLTTGLTLILGLFCSITVAILIAIISGSYLEEKR